MRKYYVIQRLSDNRYLAPVSLHWLDNIMNAGTWSTAEKALEWYDGWAKRDSSLYGLRITLQPIWVSYGLETPPRIDTP